jgi:phage-related protein
LLSKMGNTMDRNHGAYLRDDIYELRVKTRYGHIRLLYFFFRKSIIVITNGLHKKTQKVPDPEIKRAIQYREDYLSRH